MWKPNSHKSLFYFPFINWKKENLLLFSVESTLKAPFHIVFPFNLPFSYFSFHIFFHFFLLDLWKREKFIMGKSAVVFHIHSGLKKDFYFVDWNSRFCIWFFYQLLVEWIWKEIFLQIFGWIFIQNLSRCDTSNFE